jgi:SpoVK/Ycf46/Vps4 family AAA+-type ATPase
LTSIERLASVQAVAHEGDPILFVYGLGTDDAFVDTAYRVCGVEQAVWQLLRTAGFSRIGFYSLTQKLYFRDDDSRRTARPDGSAQSAPQLTWQTRRMRTGFRGPLGDRVVQSFGGGPAGPAAAVPPDAGPARPAPARGMSDPHSIQMFNQLMRDEKLPTALVFVNAAETLRHTETARWLAEFFAGRMSYQANAPHMCMLLFRQATLDDVCDYLAGLGTVPALTEHARRQLSRHSRVGLIGYPEDAELTRLVHLLRIGTGLQVADWPALPAIVRAMIAQSEEAMRWDKRLRRLAREGAPLDLATLREHGWVGSVVQDAGGVWERLARLPGLDAVKNHLETMRWRLQADARLREQGVVDAEPGSHHLVFTGNPGTGKTTVARLIGEMYRDLGVLRRGQLIETGAADLVSQNVGGTVPKTNAIVDRALDGVLFIDEAYQLSDQRSGFGQEAIDALLARMENDRERLVVIVAGYPAKMEEFLAANPGLRSRFPSANVIEFADHDPGLLLTILLNRLASHRLALTETLQADLKTALTGLHRTKRTGFGNARAMREIADEIRARWAERTRGDIDQPADRPDLPDRLRVHLDPQILDMATLLGELDAMIGLQPVKDQIRTLVNQMRLRQRRGRGKAAAPHLLFVGPPGTGKTTVARMIGQIFRTLGLLVSGHVVEAGRSDLVASYIGQTAPKTRERIAAALDGVLFIDEAYSLSRGDDSRDFGRETIDTLNQEMENYHGRLTVIAAGYPARMHEFLASNPGLKSRFTVQVEFPDYTGTELLDILLSMAASEEYALTPDAQQRAVAWFEAQRAAHPGDFGNGRAARGLLSEMEARLGARMADVADDTDVREFSIFRAEDVPDARG